MISTEEDDADEDCNEGKHVRRPGTAHRLKQQRRLTSLDHGSHTPLQPSPCAVAHTALTSSFPTADESPPLLPSPGHDATQSPAVVHRSAAPQHAHNAVWTLHDESVAATSSACTGRNIDTKSVCCHTASCDQTTLHPETKLLTEPTDYGRGKKLYSSTTASLNSKRALIGSTGSLNSDHASALACQINFAGDNKTTPRALSSRLPCHGHLEFCPRSLSLAAEALLSHREPLQSGCSSNTLSHLHRCVSQCPSSATPRSVSPSVARKPPQRQDNATRTSALVSTDRHARVDSSVGRIVFDTSSDGREIGINSKNHIFESIWLSSSASSDNVAPIPPLEQPLPPPSPPPPPDDTAPLLSPDLTDSCYCPEHSLNESSHQPHFASNAGEREVANRCVILQELNRHSNNPGPVLNSTFYGSEELLSRTLRRALIGSSKINEMHHNGDVCLGGQERPRAMDLSGDFKAVFSDSFSYGSNKSSLLSQCAPSAATDLSYKQESCSHEPSEQPFKVCDSVSETECYASSGVAAVNCTVSHEQDSLDLLCEAGSRNPCRIYASSAVDDFKNVPGFELLSSENLKKKSPSEHRCSLAKDFGNPVLFQQNSRNPDTILPTNSNCGDTTCCSSEVLLTCQRNRLISSADNGVHGLYESFKPFTLQTRCSNSSATIAPSASSFSSFISHQHTSPSSPPHVIDDSSVRLDAQSPEYSVQTAPNSLHRQARITTRETPQLSSPTLDFNCTCSSNCCKANEVKRPVSPCFDFYHDITRSVLIVSNVTPTDSTVPSFPPSQNSKCTSIFKSEASTANGRSPHPQKSVRTTEGPPTSTTVGEDDDQDILPPVTGADRESSEGKMDCDSLFATTGLVLLHSQSSQDSGIASVPLEECYPPPLSAALPTKTLTSMALDSCSEDQIGSLECDVFPCHSATPSPCTNTLENTISPSATPSPCANMLENTISPSATPSSCTNKLKNTNSTSATSSPCANTLENTISPSDDEAFVCERPNSVHDGLLQPRHGSLTKWPVEYPPVSPPGTMFRSPLDNECRHGEGPSSVSSSQSYSVARPNSVSSDAISQMNSPRQPALILSTLCSSNAWSKDQHITQEPDQVVTVPTHTHQQPSLRRSPEVALGETFEAFDSVITTHRSALKMLVPKCIPSVGDVSILCLSDTSQVLFEQDKSKANTSIFSEDRTFYPSKETAFSTGIPTGASEQTYSYLHCRASPCTGASLISVGSNGVTSNGDTGCSIIRQDNNGENLRIGTEVAPSFGKDEAPSLYVAPKVVPDRTLYMKSNEPSITSTGCDGEAASNRNNDTIFLTKLDQFASHLAKELVQESVLLSSTHAWNIRCSGQCRREQCRQDYYQSLLLLNASLENDAEAAVHNYYSPSSAVVKKEICGSSSIKATSIYSSSSSSTYGRNSSSSVGSGGWLNSLSHQDGGDRRDSMHGGSGAVSSSVRTSAMVLALPSGGSPGLCWTPELPYAFESGRKTFDDDEEEYLSLRDSDNGSGGASSGSKKLFGGGEINDVAESLPDKRSPYKFQKTISTNTTSVNMNLPFGLVRDVSAEPERRIESRGLAENISNELHHVLNPRSLNGFISSTLSCPSPSLLTSLPPSLPASLPPSRSSLSPPPSLSSTRPSVRHSRPSLSISHDSLICKTNTAYEASLDDSHLITAAFSHDALHYGGHEEVAASDSMLTRKETCSSKQARDTSNSESGLLPAATEDLPSSGLPSNGKVKESEEIPLGKDCDSNSDVFCPRADPTSCPVGKVSGTGGQKKKRRTKSRKRSSNRQPQCFSKSSSHAANQLTTNTRSNEGGKFYRKSRNHKTIDPSEVYSVPIDSIGEPSLAHPKAVIASQPRRHSHRKHRVTSSTITAGLPLINSSYIITNSNADVVSNSFGVGANGASDVGLSHSADLRVVIRDQASSKESKKKRFSSNKPSRAAVTSSVELSSPSSRQSVVSNFGCGNNNNNNNNKSSVFSSPKQKIKHPDGKQSVASDPVYMAANDLKKVCHVSSDHEVHSDTVHQTYSNTSRVSRKERHEHHSRICRILPFTALKYCKRKDHSSESRDDVYVAASAQSRTTGKNSTSDHRKRGHSLFSNIRNSLLSLFSFGSSGGCDRSLSKEPKLRLESSSGGFEGLRSSTSLDSDSQAVISTSGSEDSAGGCKGPTPAGPSAAIKNSDVTAVDLLNHSNYSAFTSAINVTSPRSAVIGAAGGDASEGDRDRGFNGGGIDGLVLSPEELNCHGDDALSKETLQRSNNAEAVIAALLVPPPLPPANDPTTNSNNTLHTAPSVSTSSVVSTSPAPLIASSVLGCRSPAPVITNRALPPLPSAHPGSSVPNKTSKSIINSSGVNASTICSASPTPPPIPPPLPQSLLSAVGLPLPPLLSATLRHSVTASIAAKASAAGAGESTTAMGRGSCAVNNEAPVLLTEKAEVVLVHGTASTVQESLATGERKGEEGCHFATMIEKVKDYGWYWGPISGKAAEKIISNEPDGSFIVRDSSDDHYIFSLTFKLNGFTRHVRIEHDQGNFSFGGYTKFKSQTIVEFIESAVEHSRSGRYLFFLHRRPVLGPMRVQLLHPVSRHRHIQSLQHLCRFVIVKNVRRDLLQQLPLPVRLRDYLTSPHYYSEQVDQCMAEEEEEQERVLQKAACHVDNIQEHVIGMSGESVIDANSIQGQDNVPRLLNPVMIEPNGVPVEQVNDLESNREDQESVSLTDPVQRSMKPCNVTPGMQSLPSGVTSREGSPSSRNPGSFLDAGSCLEDNSLLLGALGIKQDFNFRPVLQQKIQEGIGSLSLKRSSDGIEGAAGGNYMSSCSDGVRSGSCAVESPTLECHAVLEALNCLDESITQAEASIVAQAVCSSNEHSSFQSHPHPSNSCILSDNKCISAVSNPSCNSPIISRVDKDSCSNPLTTVHSNKSTCDSGATTRSLCFKSTTFSSSSAVPASGVSSKPPMSLSAYLHATPGKQIHKYKPGKIVSYQVDLASASPTVIKLTKLVNQPVSNEFRELNDSTTKENYVPVSNEFRELNGSTTKENSVPVSNEFRELNGSTTKENSVPVSKVEIDEDGNTIPTRDCISNAHFTREEHSLDPLHSKSGAELKQNVNEHDLNYLLDCCSVDGAVIGLVDLETAFRNNKVDAIASNHSSENRNTVSKSLIRHLCVLDDSGVKEDEYSGAMRKSSENDVNDHIHKEAERTDHADRNKNSVDGGQVVSSRCVVENSPHARHPTLQQSFVNSASSLPSVILNASLEELGSF